MEAEAIATRMSVLTRALPLRILLVDADPRERDSLAERLSTAGFEVQIAAHGAAALDLLARRWCPIVIADWQMPEMDGLSLAKAIRADRRDTYIILTTARSRPVDCARAYAAGVDDFLTKDVSETDLFARINAAYTTLALRRSLEEARAALALFNGAHSESGAGAMRELYAKLESEIARAERYGRTLCVITVGIGPATDSAEHDPELLVRIVRALSSVRRAHVDTVWRIATDRGAAFAVILPEASIADGQVIKDRLLGALRRMLTATQAASVSCGLAAIERGSANGVAPVVLLDVAERCRRCVGRIGGEQLETVKHSVAGHVAIACRQGYAIEGSCPLQAGERAA